VGGELAISSEGRLPDKSGGDRQAPSLGPDTPIGGDRFVGAQHAAPQSARMSHTGSDPAETVEVAALVRAARDGDRTAFGRLYDRYARMVHGILMARVPLAEVDDLVQDVFVRVLNQLHTVRDAACFGGWLATVTRNRAADYHRRSVQTVELTQDSPAHAADGRPAAATPDEGAAILALVRALPETYRETLILRLVEGMTGPEIAERTGLTHGSVRVNLHRGMQMLREKLR
jgi:RNA polymerase sigma-70 factor (ECF subfamily)